MRPAEDEGQISAHRSVVGCIRARARVRACVYLHTVLKRERRGGVSPSPQHVTTTGSVQGSDTWNKGTYGTGYGVYSAAHSKRLPIGNKKRNRATVRSLAFLSLLLCSSLCRLSRVKVRQCCCFLCILLFFYRVVLARFRYRIYFRHRKMAKFVKYPNY